MRNSFPSPRSVSRWHPPGFIELCAGSPAAARTGQRFGADALDRASPLLEQRIATFERDTGHQVALLTLPRLEGEVLEDFTIKVAQAWKLGRKSSDTGVLLLTAQKERRLRIEGGYGLEGALSDAIAAA